MVKCLTLGCSKQTVPNGFHNLTFPPDEPCQLYTGDVIDGVPWGNGTMIWRHGGAYTGQWINNHKTGIGVLTYTRDDFVNYYIGN
jgi:hypothetical protein